MPLIPFNSAASKNTRGNSILFPSGLIKDSTANMTMAIPRIKCAMSRNTPARRSFLPLWPCISAFSISPDADLTGPRTYSPRVASITALMVCIRFSASSNTTDWLDSNTSSVTSSSDTWKRSPISFPIFVLRSWKEGRQ